MQQAGQMTANIGMKTTDHDDPPSKGDLSAGRSGLAKRPVPMKVKRVEKGLSRIQKPTIRPEHYGPEWL